MPKPVKLDIYRTAIPMRGFDHAAAQRNLAEAILCRLEYDDGFVGYGETLPRDYVTGETLESVPDDLENVLWPACLADGLLNADAPPQPLPNRHDRRNLHAAACALDLAGLRRVFHDLHAIDPDRLQSLAHRARLRNYIDAKVSGVLGSKDPRKTSRRLRLLRLFGLRDFKLKLGLGEDIDAENLDRTHRQLRRALKRGEATLRVDVNGGWGYDETPDRAEALQPFGVCCVEQPAFCSATKLLDLARNCPLPLMADESLLTDRHAKTLLDEPNRIWWNLRICKNGGLLPTLKLMNLAATHHVPFTLGCMVGESSLLSAAQRRLLQLGPVPRFVEGNYGRFLLADDLLPGRRSLRFGYGGTLKPLRGDGLGVSLDETKLHRYATLLKTLQG